VRSRAGAVTRQKPIEQPETNGMDLRAERELVSARDRARAQIRAELARHRPIADAHLALEQIALSMLRFGTDAGPDGFCVDESGDTALWGDGANGRLMVPELIAYLRRKHPTLFQAILTGTDESRSRLRPSRLSRAACSRTWRQ